MRILLLTHSFNSLTQRLFGELRTLGHTVSVELDIADSVTQEAVDLFQPDVVLAPFLKRRIPQSIWQRVVCLVVHPGIPGDRGPSALDWALMRGDKQWGVTVLQAVQDMDAGEVWAWQPFVVRPNATKSSLYRREVTDAAVQAVLRALQRFVPCSLQPDPNQPDHAKAVGTWNPLMPQATRHIDWTTDNTAIVLQKIAAADGSPGVLDALFEQPCRLYDAHPASLALVAQFASAASGTLLARRGPALLRRTVDGAVWIGHVRLEALPNQPPATDLMLKLPAVHVFFAQAAPLLEAPVGLMHDDTEWDELRYREFGPESARVGWLDFEFHNGAMSERQCLRLRDALRWVRTRPTQVLVLAGGQDFFSNGIHLHAVEAAQRVAGDSAADASWRNINAMNDATLELLTLTDRITVAALHGNAGAGGCFLALAADLAPERVRPRVVALMYTMLLLGMLGFGALFGVLLTHFTPTRLIQVVQAAAVLTLVFNLAASWKQEARRAVVPKAARPVAPSFSTTWARFASTGRTLVEAARGALARGAVTVDVAVTHALMVADAMQALRAAGVRHVWSTDSVPHPSNVVSIGPMVAQALAGSGASA